MRKTIASAVVIAFAGLFCTGLLAVFNHSAVNNYIPNAPLHEPVFFMAY